MHRTHHTKLGTLPLAEARHRARIGQPTDGDLGIASRLFAPPSRRYSVVVDAQGRTEGRVSEARFQATSALLHLIAPLVFVGFGASALGSVLRSGHTPADGLTASRVDGMASPSEGAERETVSPPSTAERIVARSLLVQAAASVGGWALVAGASAATGSAAPLLLYVGSQLVWLSPLNPNWIWTCPHVCAHGSRQPTVRRAATLADP